MKVTRICKAVMKVTRIHRAIMKVIRYFKSKNGQKVLKEITIELKKEIGEKQECGIRATNMAFEVDNFDYFEE